MVDRPRGESPPERGVALLFQRKPDS